jgi:hypothetical protein
MATTEQTYTGPQTAEALFAERRKFWGGFMNATTGCVIGLLVLLALMGIFLT